MLIKAFLEQVKRSPEKAAIKTNQKTLTYSELNRYSNQVAHRILEKCDPSHQLTKNETIRYKRQMLIEGWDIDGQEKLKNTTVFVAGAGGSGSPLIMQLALCGIGKIIVCDDDVVELSNLNRQCLHDESRIGMLKVESAQLSISKLNPNVNIITRSERITKDNVDELVGDSAIIFDNVDHLETKFVLSKCAVQKQIPHIISSMIDLNAYVAIFHSPKTPCFHCLYDIEKLKEIEEIEKYNMNYKKIPNSVASPSLFLSTGFACNEAIKIILGLPDVAYNKYFLFNQRGSKEIVNTVGHLTITYPFSNHFRETCQQQGFSWEEGWRGNYLEELLISHNPDCPMCGSRAVENKINKAAEKHTKQIKEYKAYDQAENQKVALLFEHGIDMIVGTIGALKACKTYVPFDPSYPENRLLYMLENSEAELIITNNANYDLAHKLIARSSSAIRILNIDDNCNEALDTEIEREEKADRIAYLLYTSGSTGTPKGVMQSHKNVLHFIKNYIKSFDITEKDRLTLFSSFGHDAAVMDIYSSLLSGATLYPLNIRRQINIVELHKWLTEEQISIWHSVPTLYRFFVNTLDGEKKLNSLRYIILGGESVLEQDAAKFRRLSEHAALVNLYGQSESSYNSSQIITSKEDFAGINLGEPISDTKMYVLNKKNKVAASLSAGEIVIASDYLALGYWQDEAKTEKAFENHPEFGRIYRTGDMGCLTEEGVIEYLGRNDFQIKIRGFRVELEEVENCLLKHEAVETAAVIGKEDSKGNKYICGYFTSDEELSVSALREFIAKELPDYMIPAYFTQLDKLPLTGTGKLDRAALKEVKETAASQKLYEAPENEVEQKLAEMWQEVLGIDRIGINDSFFELGGHSLNAVSLIGKIHKAMNVEVPLKEIFKAPTIKGLSEYIESLGVSQYQSIEKAEKRDYYELSSAQKRMYILQQMEPDTISYNMPGVLVMEGELDEERLKTAMTEIVKRHEALRTSFKWEGTEVVQVVHEEVVFEVAYKDGSEEIDAEIKDFIKPFDLSNAPLLRVELVKVRHDKHILMYDMHHIISDGASIAILVSEFVELYQKKTLQALPLQYKDYVTWQNKPENKVKIEQQGKYWLDLLRGEIPLLAMPLDYERKENISFAGNTVYLELESSIVEGLKKFAQKENITLNMLLLSCYNILLSQYTGQEDIVVGSLVSNRSHSDLSHVMGAFINYLPIRSKIDKESSITAFLRSQKNTIAQAYNQQEYPFDKIVENIGYKTEAGRNPIFDTMLIYHNEFDRRVDIKIDKLNISQYEFNTPTATLDFKLDIYMEHGAVLKCYMEYKTGLYKETTMQQLLKHYKMVLEGIVKDSEAKLSDIQIFTQQEQKEIEKKRIGNTTGSSDVTLNVAASFTSEPIEAYVRWWCERNGVKVKIQFAPYNQVFQELLDAQSMTSKNTGINLLLLRFEDWIRDTKANEQVQKQTLENQYDRLLEAIRNRSTRALAIIGIFPVSEHLGLSEEIINCIEKLYKKMTKEISSLEGISILDFTNTAALYAIKEVFDAVRDRTGHMPFSDAYYAAIGTVVARKICAIRRNPFKIIAVDCDNTLWRGICGEDGALGVKIEKPYEALQKLLIRKQEEGMLVVLCSKNNEADVFEVFDKHPDMLLKKEQLAGWKINWRTKSENVKQLAEEMNLGIDSFIFIDDNPAECLDMMKNNPQVLTLQLPEEPQQIEQYLKHVWAFDKEKVTEEDKIRTKLYQVEKQRKEIQSSSFTLDEFLKELKLKVYINNMNNEQISRVSQLTQRTNQFNLSTVRRTEKEVEALFNKSNTRCWVIEVEDRFGEYGLTGVVIIENRCECLFIDTFLLSCRVLGRGIEAVIMAELGKYCQREGISKIEAVYYPTQKNQIVADFLDKNQWKKTEESKQHTKYELQADNIAAAIDYIECYFGKPSRQKTEEAVISHIEGCSTAQAEAVAVLDEVIENNWQVAIENEEELLHINYLLPLRYCTGQMLLELPANENKENNIKHESYEAARNPLEEKLVKLWEEILKVDGIGINDNFYDVGGNSFTLLTLHSKIDSLYPGRIKATDLFNLTSIKKIAAYINQKEADSDISYTHTEERTVREKIAIIGIAAKLPLGHTIEEIYEGLKNGVDCVKVMSDGRRQDIEDYVRFAGGNEAAIEFLKEAECGFIGDIDKFDYSFFNISPKEASLMDPCQRIFLETAWEAIEDAGYGGNKIKGSRTGVFIGHNSLSSGMYSKLVTTVDEALYQMSIAGNVPMIIASRISYLLDLRGPAILMDTACSSSLTAVYSACSAIKNNDCDMAIAGGIKLYLPSAEGMFNGMDKLGIVSSSNRTKAFDDNSDGTGFGEGISAILLKPLEKALEDGDNIYAVIDGGAMNQDGSSIGITAPNPEAQEDLLLRAWQNAGVSPENITYIEAHGTGTKLGDQIELESMNRAFRRYTEKMQFCAISSIKTNIGHLESAAGIAGLLKAVISLRYKELFPNIHFTTPRREIDFIKAPYYVNVKHQAWQKNDSPRICGVSSFGLGGTNCHLVLEEAPYREYDSEPWGEMPQILALSAKTENSLKRLVARYKKYFDDGIEGSLSDICYTANTGRGHYKYRLAIIAGTKLALEDKINRLASEGLAGDEYDGIYYSHDPLNEKISADLDMSLHDEEQVLEKSLDELCRLYINDAEINWAALYQESDNRRKVRLPAYQFEENRCWVSIPEGTIRRNIVKEAPELPISKQIKEIELAGRADKNYTQTEKLIGQVLGELMGFDTLNINDDFYELGGDSLIAMDVVDAINQKLLTNVKVRDLLGTPIICEFCEVLDTTYLNRRTNEAGIEKIKKVEERDYYPVSSAQKRVYILSMLESNSTFYNIPSVVMLSGSIDRQRFEMAFRTLIDRHESLRTSFEMLEGNPIQRIHATAAFEISYMEADESKAAGIIKAFIRPFDLSTAPLMRIGLLKISEEKHLLLFDIHHSIADGLSMNIIMGEYKALYNGEELPAPALQYKDYAVWQSEYASSEQIKSQKEFWLDTFSGELPILNMPTDYPRPAVQCFDGDIVRKSVPMEVLESLNRKAAETGTTLFMLLLAAYNVLLFKYTSQEDIIIGSPISGRRNVQLNSVIGMFANTIALRNRPTGNKSFKAFLDEVRKNALDSYDKQDFQFEDLVESLDIRRDMSRNPLFDVMLNFLYPEEAAKEAEFSLYPFENRISKFDMTIHAAETKSGLELSLEYNIGLFKQETAKKLLEHYVNIIKNVVAFPDRRLSEIDMLDELEKNQLLEVFNNTDAVYQKEKTIHQLFEEQAERVPDKTAVVFENRALTYKELNQRSNQLANKLRGAGVTVDSIVGIIAECSLEMVVGILGILKAGGAYLPIDPEYPADRISYMLEDSGAKLLLTYTHLLEETSKNKQILLLDNEDLYTGNIDNLQNTNKPTDLIYVIYTSGTTGKPKGVMLEHKNLVNYISWFTAKAGIIEEDKTMLVSSAAFDLGYTALYSSILQGAELHVMSRDTYTDPEALIKYINDKGISYIKLTPSLYSTICSCDSFLEGRALDSLRLVVLGGENINTADVESTYKLYRNIQIMNHYGPTEATVGAVACMISAKQPELEAFMRKPVIGRPISNSKIYILDKYLRPTAIGVPGELCIAGDGLARGYLNRQSLTEERFVPNPFIAGDRIYRTGDMACWLPDGNIEFLGRIDQQVKIRGYRIELGEIENQLMKHESVREAVVTARTDQRGQYICAYFVAESELGIVELREHMTKLLPAYMIPSYFMQLDKMPVTQNGKIDYKALPEPGSMIDTGVTYEAPRNEVEAKLVSIWQELLKVEQIGINDSFFELGGHSLKATAMAARVHKAVNVEVPLKEIFMSPTIKAISEYIGQQKKSSYEAIERVEEAEYYPASSAQKRLYTLQQMEPNSIGYNTPTFFELEGEINKELLQNALQGLINRHESLRTSFFIEAGAVAQKIHKELPLKIAYYTVDNEQKIKEIASSFVKAFKLNEAPLMRVGLIEVQPNRHIMLIDIHHIISDGASVELIVKDFVSLYSGRILPELRLQYKDYAAWQQNRLKTEALKKQEAYWENEFSREQNEGEIPILNLPTDYQRPNIQSFEGNRIKIKTSKVLAENLGQLGKTTGTTLYMLLLSGLNVLLSKYSGQEDIIIGTPIAGRPHGDLENIMGLFINTLAMRNRPNGYKTFREFLQEVKEKALKAYENQEYQFEELVEKVNVRRDMSRNPIFDVMLILQNMDMTEIQIEGLKLKPYFMENKISKLDITFTAEEKEATLELTIEYCSSLYNKDTIERMAGHYLRIMERVVEEPDIKLEAITLINEEEKKQLLWEFNATKAEYPSEKTIHQMFEEQAKLTPESIAVVFDENQLTYRELNEKANQLARVLRNKGVGEDCIIGIMVRRSIDMMVGIMGILKAGGAYLPIDPEYPQDRIQYMLEDSGASVLLTQTNLLDKVQFSGEIIKLDSDIIYEGDNNNLAQINASSSLAYTIYTSGSTGKPKGVMISHKSVVNFIKGITDIMKFREGEGIICLTSISFDIFGLESLLPITVGMRVVIADEEAQVDAIKLARLIKKNKIDILQATPSRMQMLLSSKEGRSCAGSPRIIMVGGEQFPQTLLEELRKITASKIYNMYGPTETTIWSTVKEVTNEERVTIGKPIANTRIYILAQNNSLQPIGVPGELCIAGEGLARGYINNAELTMERFAVNPFNPEERIYRTGDLASWLPDGSIEFIGRIDQQVKVRGYRVELGEIENQLLKHELVREAVVTAREDNLGNKYLCAYIRTEGKLSVTELRQHLANELPYYMIPSYFILLDELPLTPNGKINRLALPEPDKSVDIEAAYEAPRDEVEEKLAEMWREVLKLNKVGINDSFFELGGHSLKATSMVSKLQKELNVEVPLREVFKMSTIKGLAQYIKSCEKSNIAAIQPVKESEYYELSPAQARIYTMQLMDKDSTAYNISGFMEVKGAVDRDKFEQVFRKLINRHESLRTSFELLENGPVQRIHDEIAFAIQYEEAKEAKDIEAILQSFIRPFDLTKAPLLRVGLIKAYAKDKGEEKQILAYDLHHIIADGTSLAVLAEEFTSLYEGKELPKLGIQYKDYAKWQLGRLEGEEQSKYEEYWLQKYKGELPVLNLPTDYPRPSIQSYEGDTYTFRLNEGLLTQLKSFAAKTETTLFMLLMEILSIVLSKHSGQEDIIIGTVSAGRQNEETERLVGLFLNSIAIRCLPQKEKTAASYLHELRDNILGAYENQDYPIEALIRKLNIKKDMSRNVLFDVMLILQNYERQNAQMSAEQLAMKPYHWAKRASDYDMSLYAAESGKELMINVRYCTRLFKEKTIEAFGEYFCKVAYEIVSEPEQKLAAIPMPEEAAEKVIYKFNNEKAGYSKEKTLRQLNETEEKLVRIWQEVLQVEKVGIEDNFFELGGHSLRATNIIGRINELFDVEMPLREMLMLPTIKGVAEYISNMEKKVYEEIPSAGHREYYPVSSIQKRIYIIQQFDETSTSYNTPTVMIFEGSLDKESFEAAFRRLTERHEAFRTSFEFEGEQIVQKIHDISCHIQYAEAEEANIPSIIKKFIQPFDLSKAPLIRIKLVKTAADRHILMLDAHHIILDGTSIEIMVDEFIRLYEGETLAPLRIQYKDYAVWQIEIMDKASLKKQEQYWVKTFEGELPVLNLPTDFPRPEVQSSEGDVYSIILEKELSNQLNELAINQGVTLFTLLLAIYNITISKFSGQNDIVVGTVTAGRSKKELSELVGVFLNNIAFRCKIDVEMRFDTYLNALKGTVIDGYENQHYPIEELIEKLDLRKDMSRNTLFDVMIVHQNFESRISHIKNNSFKVSRYPSNNMSSKCDMILSIIEGVKGLILNFGYCTRLFKKETIEGFAHLFSSIAGEIAANPQKQLKEIDILSEEKKQQLLEAFNQTKADYPYDKVFHQMFEEQAEKTPDRLALVYEKEQMTYKELNEKSNQLARLLREKGIRNECIVGVMVDRSIEMIIAILAVLKAGGAYLPIDPEYPQDRIEYMLYDSEVQILLTQTRLAQKLQFKGETIDIKDKSIYTGDSSNLQIINTPTDLIYVIYTSGTTNKPKGVMVEHRNLINIADGWRKAYKLEESEIKLLQMASMSFDVFAGDLSRALLNGGKMIICPSDVRLDPPSLYRLMKEHQINMFESTPALVIPLMEYIYDSKLEVDWLKLLILGSDSCLISDFRRLLERFSGSMRILNSYGITEATIDSSYYEAPTANIEGEGNVPIGKPMQNTSFYVLDESMKPKAIGQYGELYIGGAGVARGYLNKPELTEERFIADPFMQGGRMYKTGDLVKWNSNGNVEFLGRLDNQVKIRGYRIELGEIESHLISHEAIKDAVVVPWGEGSDKYLCAYIVTEAAKVQDTIRSYLAELMPDYMIPAYYMQIDSIPLTPNGKVDRKALPKPSGYARLGHAYEAPLTQTEKELVRIWEVLLHTEGIGALDNFFELGGHSLKATMLVGRLYKELGFELPLKEVFKAPTIRAMGDYIDRHRDKEKIYGDESLILLRKAKNQKKTLFLIHDISCDVNGYKNFCSSMKADINCWGIKADIGKGYGPVWREVEEIAVSYVEKIKTLQSEGPYYLGGWSVGGIIAFEMARQLEQQGQQVEGIWLFDTDSPSDEGKGKSSFSLADEMKFISSILSDNWLSEKAKTVNTTDELWLEAIAYMERHGVSVESIIKLMPKYAKQLQAVVENLEINETVRYVNLIRTINRAIYDYLPSTKIKAAVHLIKAKDSNWLKPVKWEVYIENHYEVTEIEGNHFTIFNEPNVHGLIEAFDKSIEEKA